MLHPFVDLELIRKQGLEEIQTQISTMNSRLNFAQRMGNRAMINQLMMVIESYRHVYNEKVSEMMEKQKIGKHISVENRKD